ncbi:hypothetical protein HYH02_000917 [Chlamydomonas schloesseri]|uniref:Cation efflux protein cytoplasmic domain-containing protein n=1 Tax=Chlamydomonas schloesseri TaxID=2026947 RepID=A0A835WW25_9CHLO|nr:hypothetical protein HYH02_000917 [Chlamydomonas schloesseri]|eukprot:KAG2455097.1 hypothetical protein HYH02_000917 [Chlamydomonas schloesseri]
MAQLAREVILGSTADLADSEAFTAQGANGFAANRSSFRRPSHASLTGAEDAPPSWAMPRAHTVESLADLEAPLLPPAPPEGVTVVPGTQPEAPGQTAAQRAQTQAFARKVRIGINASWVVNILLLVAKTVVFILSGSYAVLASAVDSLVDLLSQVVLAVAEYQAATYDRRFPIGRTRMAELSVLACAAIMFVSTSLVIRESVGALWDGFHGEIPPLDVGSTLFAVLGSATAGKLGLYLYCVALRKNPIMVALSEDHLNDVQSNLAAIVGAAVASNLPKYWYVDPIVALLFSVLIIKSWMGICWEQGQKMVGLGAPDELIEAVNTVTQEHHVAMQLDRVTAYHHGSNMVVEVEVLLPADMSVRESHDIALALQHKIEALDTVERAYVHVDYERRSLEEHKVERNLKLGVRDVMKPLPEALERLGSAGGSGLISPSPTSSAAAAGAGGNGGAAGSNGGAGPQWAASGGPSGAISVATSSGSFSGKAAADAAAVALMDGPSGGVVAAVVTPPAPPAPVAAPQTAASAADGAATPVDAAAGGAQDATGSGGAVAPAPASAGASRGGGGGGSGRKKKK